MPPFLSVHIAVRLFKYSIALPCRMALFNRVGNVLRSNVSASVQSPTLTAVRFMSSQLFVGGMASQMPFFDQLHHCFSFSYDFGIWYYYPLCFVGLSYGTDSQSLKEAFSSFGDVIDGEILLYVSMQYYCSCVLEMDKYTTRIINYVLLLQYIFLRLYL